MAYTFSPITYKYNPDAYYTGYGRAGAGFRPPTPFFTPVAGDPVTLQPGSNNWGNQWGRGPTQFPQPPEQPGFMQAAVPLAVHLSAGYIGSKAGDLAEQMAVLKDMGVSSTGGGAPSVFLRPDGSTFMNNQNMTLLYDPTKPFTIPEGSGWSNVGETIEPLFDVDYSAGPLESMIEAPYAGLKSLGSEIKAPFAKLFGGANKVSTTAPVGPFKASMQRFTTGVSPKTVGAKPKFNPRLSDYTATPVAPVWGSTSANFMDQLGTNFLRGGMQQGAVSGIGAGIGSIITDALSGGDINWKRAGTKAADVGLGATLGKTLSGSGFWGGITGGIAGLLRVICTELNSQGLLTDDELRAEQWYTLKKIHPLVIRGYHVWAVPYVRLMQKSSRFSVFTNWWAGARAKEILYKCGKRDKPHYGGKLARLVVEPFCFVIGCVAWALDIPELEWRNGLT